MVPAIPPPTAGVCRFGLYVLARYGEGRAHAREQAQSLIFAAVRMSQATGTFRLTIGDEARFPTAIMSMLSHGVMPRCLCQPADTLARLVPRRTLAAPSAKSAGITAYQARDGVPRALRREPGEWVAVGDVASPLQMTIRRFIGVGVLRRNRHQHGALGHPCRDSR
jgi:hypothetical protein